MKKVLFTLFLLFICIPLTSAKDTTIYLFYSSSCPHCKSEQTFLNTLKDVEIKKFEVKAYSRLYSKVKENLNITETYVPLTIIGSDYLIGYSDDTKNQIIDMINSYNKKDYCNVVEYILDDKNIEKCLEKNKNIYNPNPNRILNIFGYKFNYNIKNVSLPLISILMGLIDGFNPCAMWVLVFLISMLFNMKNRKRMWILGLTFLVSSSIVYLIFMLGLLNVANIVGYYFKYLIALIALLGGIFNLNGFRKSLKKEVGCQVTDKKKRKKIIDKINSIIGEKHFVISIIGIIALSFSINLVELACSAGLPTLFIEILSLNNLNSFEYWIYIILYIIMFMIDDIIIFIIAMTTLKLTGISNKYTKYSHLIGGIIMILIGLLMLFKVDWLMFNF